MTSYSRVNGHQTAGSFKSPFFVDGGVNLCFKLWVDTAGLWTSLKFEVWGQKERAPRPL